MVSVLDSKYLVPINCSAVGSKFYKFSSKTERVNVLCKEAELLSNRKNDRTHTLEIHFATKLVLLEDYNIIFLIKVSLICFKEGLCEVSFLLRMDLNLNKRQEIVKGREAWHAAVHGVTKGGT